ncbi:unnamed protein product, partial [Mesorhabditis spiculigera]
MAEGKAAFVLGATGAVGRKFVEVLAADPRYSRVVLLGRRIVDQPDAPAKIEQRVIDFEKLEDHRSDFEGFDVGFCALGTTRGKSGVKGQYRVDHDYVVDSAKLAKDNGTKTFCLVSSSGANENSMFFYPKTKGETERDLKTIGFEHLVIARPAFLEGPRDEFRLGEAVAKIFVKPFKLLTSSIAIDTIDVARALVSAASNPSADPVRLIDNKELIDIAKEYKEAAQQKN